MVLLSLNTILFEHTYYSRYYYIQYYLTFYLWWCITNAKRYTHNICITICFNSTHYTCFTYPTHYTRYETLHITHITHFTHFTHIFEPNCNYLDFFLPFNIFVSMFDSSQTHLDIFPCLTKHITSCKNTSLMHIQIIDAWSQVHNTKHIKTYPCSSIFTTEHISTSNNTTFLHNIHHACIEM